MIPLSGEREPSSTEYGMAAILTYASVYFMNWMLTQNPGKKWVVLIAYPVYYIGSLYPAYLLASRTKHTHLLIGLKSAVYGWCFSGFSLWVLTGTTSFIFLALLLLSMLLGGFTGSYISLKRQLRRETLAAFEESTNIPEADE